MNDATADRTASDIPGASLIAPLADGADQAVTIAKENVGLIIAGGVALGLVAATVLPRSKKKKAVKKAKKISSLIGELTAVLAAQASDAGSAGLEKVSALSGSLSDTVSDTAATAKKQAGTIASDTADQLNDSGKAIARTVIKLVEKFKS